MRTIMMFYAHHPAYVMHHPVHALHHLNHVPVLEKVLGALALMVALWLMIQLMGTPSNTPVMSDVSQAAFYPDMARYSYEGWCKTMPDWFKTN